MLTEAEKAFVERRRRLIHLWPYVGSGMLVLIIGFAVWLVITRPLMANPFFVMAAIERGGINQSTLELMAVMLPIAIWTALFVCLATVFFSFAAFSNEKKYQALLDKYDGSQELPHGS